MLLYGAVAGGLIDLLKLIEYRHFVRAYPSEVYGGLIALIFSAVGIYLGLRWAGPAKEGCASENYIKWRIEGTNGLAIGDIGWCKDPFTTPSDIRYASKGHAHFECPTWKESWFPDAFIGTKAQLLIALEDGTEPAISGRDNLKTMALVEAAYQSAAQFKSIGMDQMERVLNKNPEISHQPSPTKP